MSDLHTIGILSQPHEVDTWNSFPTILKEFPEVLSTCFPSLSGPTHPKPSLDLDQVIMDARSSDAALHHTPWTNSSYIT